MLIVDAQIHIWKGHKPTNPNHRQIADYTAADVLKEMDEGGVDAAVIHPPGWDPNSNALAIEAARQHPNRLAILANFPLDKPESRSAIDGLRGKPGMLGLRFALLQPHQQTWLTDGSLDWLWTAAERAARPRPHAGDRQDRRAAARAQADHRPLRATRRAVVGAAGPGRRREAPQRGAEGDRRAELFGRALSVSRHPRPHQGALRCVRPGAHVLGDGHHADAVSVEAVRDDVHRRAALADGEGQRADHGAGALQLARLEAAGEVKP